MSSEITTHKVIIAGLDSAGKTSIYKKMVEGEPSELLDNLSPTKGVERRSQVIMDHQIIFWDLGGQQSYRSSYFKDEKTFLGTSLVIYVLDVQDRDRFDESLEYLLQILMVIKNLDYPPRVFVLIHKFDPDKINDLKSNFLEASQLLREVKNIPSLQIIRFPTSIYSKDLNFVFTKIIRIIIPDYTNPLLMFMDEAADDIEETIQHSVTQEELSNESESSINLEHKAPDEDLKMELTEQFNAAISKIRNKIEGKIEEEEYDGSAESFQG